ncbi:putative reverse transcriptase domain-containing protein, partial [Tanacetum coccineum]
LRKKGSLKTLLETIKTNNNRTRDRTLAGPILQGLVKRSHMGDLNAKCNYHHDGLCAPKCHKCNKVGHFARDCRSAGNANNTNNQRGIGSGQKSTSFECGVQGHFKCHTPKRGLVGIRVRGHDVITIRSQSNKERPLIMDV